MTNFSVGGGGGGGGGGWHWTLPPPSPPPIIIKSHLRDRPANLIPIPEEDAEIRWGKPSQFQWSVTNPDRIFNRNIYRPSPDDDDEDPLQELIEYTETARTTETVRVSNPADAEQYVDVKRILTITFQGPNGGAKGDIEIFHKFTLNQWTNP